MESTSKFDITVDKINKKVFVITTTKQEYEPQEFLNFIDTVGVRLKQKQEGLDKHLETVRAGALKDIQEGKEFYGKMNEVKDGVKVLWDEQQALLKKEQAQAK